MLRRRPQSIPARRPYALTTAERLLAHVVALAGEIGDRNVFRPGALEAAAEEYQVKDVTCANLEVERLGFEPTGGILLIGTHSDSVRGCPAAARSPPWLQRPGRWACAGDCRGDL
jgi:hypothetical protein